MKKSELKNIIKECVREVVFEEGMLSGIISEVVQGISSSPTVNTSRPQAPSVSPLAETKRQVLSAIGNNSYEEIKKKFPNPELFEGTKPIVDSGGQGALSGISPHDPGVDISSIPGAGAWGRIASGKDKR